MTNTTRDVLTEWLARGNVEHKRLLSLCNKVDTDAGGKLLLDCPKSVWEKLLAFSKELDWLATGRLVTDISLWVDGVEQNCFTPESVRAYPANQKEQVDIFGLKLAKQINFGSQSAIAVVEMGTNAGVFCTRKINEISRIPDEYWRENDMKAYHIPEEYTRFIGALETHETIQGFEFHAITRDGNKYWQCVNAYLGMLGDRQVRVSEVVDYRIIG